MDAPDPDDSQALLAHLGWLRALSRQLVADQQVADDLAQDACLIALEGRPEDPTHVRSWLRGVMENLVLKRARVESQRRVREAEGARRVWHEAAGALVERVEAQGELVRMVLELDEPYRDVVLLRYFEELSHEEIARRMGLVRTTVQSRLERAHARLRHRLERSLGDDPRVWSVLLLGIPLDSGSMLLAKSGGVLLSTKLVLAVAGAVAVASLLAVLTVARDDSALRPVADLAAVPRALASTPSDVARGQQPDTDRVAVEGPPSAALLPLTQDPAPTAAAALAGASDRLREAMEASLAGDVDVGAFLGLARQLADLQPDPRIATEPELGGALQYPLIDGPGGLAAVLKVDRSSNPAYGSPLLSLRVELERPTSAYVVEGAARMPPDLEVSAFTDRAGRPLVLNISTSFRLATETNRELGIATAQGRAPLSLSFTYNAQDPMSSTARMSWAQDGKVVSGDVDWRFVGGRLPTQDDLERYSAQLQALHAALRR